MDRVLDLLTIIGTVLAAMGSLAAVAVAVEQLVLPSRMRRIVTWVTELLEVEESPQRRAVLGEVRDRAASYVVAASMVSSRRYVLEAALWLLGGAAVVVSVWMQFRSVWLAVVFMVLVLLATLNFVGRVVRLHVERERIRQEYLSNQAVSAPGQVTTGAQWGYAALLIGAVLVLVFSIAWAATEADTPWPRLITAAGVIVVVVAAFIQTRSLVRNLPRVEDHLGPEMSEALTGYPRRDSARDEPETP